MQKTPKMIQSMTGYGKSVAELPNKKITVEIKSLNSKQFDLFTRMPMIYREKEIALRNDLSRKLERGKIDFNLNVEIISKDVSSKIDHNVLKQYHREIKNLAAEMNVNEPQDWFVTLLRLPDVMKQDVEELDENEWKTIENIRSLLAEVNLYETERLEKIKSKISEGLANLENIDYDKNRFEQEMIYYIEKLDVNEEKSRLTNHLDYFLETLKDVSGSQGKKLGFIAQEIGREVNTLGSKSNHSEMQRIVVQMKDELEQIKEQILNVL